MQNFLEILNTFFVRLGKAINNLKTFIDKNCPNTKVIHFYYIKEISRGRSSSRLMPPTLLKNKIKNSEKITLENLI